MPSVRRCLEAECLRVLKVQHGGHVVRVRLVAAVRPRLQVQVFALGCPVGRGDEWPRQPVPNSQQDGVLGASR